jgi:serine/threonine-protein kinase
MTGHELLGGRYELRGVLGYGGMAEVRDGWDTRLHRAVAIKLLHPALNAQPDIRSRFVAEARAAAGLTHPNIVAVHDFGEHHGTPFMVMERLSGNTLESEIERGPLTSARLRSVLDDVLAALAAAHSAGVLHRDIKPGNVLCSDAAVKVADFGIAKTLGSPQTMTGQVVGTMAYMSPERLAGAPASVADDLYAVGVIGYEAASGQRPFPQLDLGALVGAVMGGSVPPLSAVRPGLDATQVAAIERAMARDPGRRFASADDMRAALHGHHVAFPPTAAVGPPRPARTKMFTAAAIPAAPNANYVAPQVRRRRPITGMRKFLIASAAVVALIVATLAFALDSSSQQAPTPTVTTPTVTTTSTTTTPSSTAVTTPPSVPSVEQPPVRHGPPGNGGGKRKKNGD